MNEYIPLCDASRGQAWGIKEHKGTSQAGSEDSPNELLNIVRLALLRTAAVSQDVGNVPRSLTV